MTVISQQFIKSAYNTVGVRNRVARVCQRQRRLVHIRVRSLNLIPVIMKYTVTNIRLKCNPQKDELQRPTTWISSSPRRPAMTLTFDLQNLIRSLVEASEYSLSVLSKLFKAFFRYTGNNICVDERSNERTNEATNEQTLRTDRLKT